MAGDENETLVAPVTTGGATPVPTTIAGRYEILGLIGVGGMGAVYRARDRELDEVVALKMLRRELVELPGILERFRREVKLARRVTHKNVARTFDIGEHAGEKFLTMEYVEGESLAAVIERHGMLPVAKIAEIVEPALEGLAAAHAAGVVHRDLKPDNILIAREGRVVITDFGVARAYDTSPTATMGAPIGTPAYMAPEQVEGAAEIDARADLYALGVMLFEMATGERPYRTGSAMAIAMARLLHDAPDPRTLRQDLPDGLVEIIRKCMQRRREDRPPGAREVAAALALVTRQPEAAAPAAAARPAAPVAPPAPVAATPSAAKTVAVLPFRNAGPPEDDYLADGLTDDLIDTLSMARGLRVRSRGAVADLKQADRDPRALGRALDVQVVVDGSLRRAGDLLRISTRVVSVADGFQLWAKRFDRPAAEVLKVADEAARAVAEALTVESAPSRQALTDAAALDLYLRARHEYHRFGWDHVVRAIELYEKALERAPEDPMVLSGLAIALVRMWFFGGPGARDAGERAKEVARRASQAAPDRGEPRSALASILFHSGDPANAVRELKRALAAAPYLADAHETYGRILLEIGRFADGEGHLLGALALDPGIAGIKVDLVRSAALQGDWARADELASRAGELEVRAQWLAHVRMALWRRDDARILRALEQDVPMEVPLVRALIAMVRDRQRPPSPNEIGWITDAPDAGRRRLAFFHQLMAEGAAYLGRADEALEAIERSIDGGLIDLAWIDRCPLLVPLQGHPRYAALRARVAERVAPIFAAVDERA